LIFSDRIARMPYTLDPCDLLLTQLQIVHLNEKDAQDVIYLASGVPVRDGDEPGTIALDRLTRILGEDWGWWRTVTLNVDKIRTLAQGEGAHLVPAGAPFAADEQLGRLRQAADDAPKSLKWKLRSKVGERKRWYELPEESEHY